MTKNDYMVFWVLVIILLVQTFCLMTWIQAIDKDVSAKVEIFASKSQELDVLTTEILRRNKMTEKENEKISESLQGARGSVVSAIYFLANPADIEGAKAQLNDAIQQLNELGILLLHTEIEGKNKEK